MTGRFLAEQAGCSVGTMYSRLQRYEPEEAAAMGKGDNSTNYRNWRVL